MNQNGRGTLTPSDDPGHSEQHLSQQPLDAAATTARLRGISSNSQRPPVQGQPVSTQSSQHYTNQKSALQLKAHQRLAESSAHKLAPVSSKRPHAPSTLGSHKSALVAKKLSAHREVELVLRRMVAAASRLTSFQASRSVSTQRAHFTSPQNCILASRH
jgi:hypothetical protein